MIVTSDPLPNLARPTMIAQTLTCLPMDPLARSDDCTLLVIDTQVQLVPAMAQPAEIVRRCVQLATAARGLGVHVIGTEQNPDGLGPLVPETAALCDTILAKSHFSAAAEEGFLDRLPAGRHTLVLCGCEAHVGVMQTAVGLIAAGYAVKWVADATGSRRQTDAHAAAERARHLGADVVTTEMVLFEWLRTSAHPQFGRLLELMR